MTTAKTSYDRRSFPKVSALVGGGILIGFDLFANAQTADIPPATGTLPSEGAALNSFIKITPQGEITCRLTRNLGRT